MVKCKISCGELKNNFVIPEASPKLFGKETLPRFEVTFVFLVSSQHLTTVIINYVYSAVFRFNLFA
jgi:hypothetical protein